MPGSRNWRPPPWLWPTLPSPARLRPGGTAVEVGVAVQLIHLRHPLIDVLCLDSAVLQRYRACNIETGQEVLRCKWHRYSLLMRMASRLDISFSC